jgi:hypothetical protein
MDSTNKQGVGALQATENDEISHISDLFKPISQEISLKSGQYTCYRPLNSTHDPYEFVIHPQGMQYIHLAKTRLFVQLKVVNADGTNMLSTANVAPCNLMGHSLWKAIDLKLGGTEYPDLGNTHANYKAYLETVLSYCYSAANSHLKASQFEMDSAGLFDILTPNDNQVFKHRKTLIAGSKSLQIYGPVHCDFLQIDRLLPPGISLSLKFTRAPDNFVLMTDDAGKAYKIVIEDIKLYVRHVTLSDSIVRDHIMQFETKSAIYPMSKNTIQTYVFPAGHQKFHVTNIVSDLFPKTIIVTFLSSGALNGSYALNPYNFKHFGLNFAVLKLNGELVPSDPYTPDFDNNLFVREYRDVFDNIGVSHDDIGNCLTPSLYKGGLFFLAWDLSPDMCNGYHCHPKRTGHIDLELGFKAALTETLNVLTFTTFDAQVLIDKSNKVTIEGAI